MVVMIALVACTPTRGNEPKPEARDPKLHLGPDEQTAQASDLAPAIEARRLAAIEELRQGHYDAGRAALVALAAEVGPSYPLLNDLAVAEGLAEHWQAALGAANDALALDPTGLEANVNKVEALLALGNRARALDIGQYTVDRYPNDVSAHIALGKACFSLGRYREARTQFERALDLDASDLTAGLGVLASVSIDPAAPELDEIIARLLKQAPDDPEVLHLVGTAYERRIDDKSARTYYERAIALADQRGQALPWAHYNLGRLLQRTVGLDAARPHYTKFIASAPPSAALEREALEQELANPKDAP